MRKRAKIVFIIKIHLTLPGGTEKKQAANRKDQNENSERDTTAIKWL